MSNAPHHKRLVAAALANGLVAATLFTFMALSDHAPETFYRAVQEDAALEWATFWTFLGAAFLNCLIARRRFRDGGGIAFFALGVSLFCLLAAGEEISWGQRLLGYRPPVYFLENNYQQEFNLHNVIERSWSSLALQLITLGYGVALPLAARIDALGRWLTRVSVEPPSVLLIPVFVLTSIVHETYLIRFAGEVAECMLGMGFVFAALLRSGDRQPVTAVGVAALLVCGLAFASAWASAALRHASADEIAAARREMDALRRDFVQRTRLTTRPPVRCGFENRVYTYRRDHRAGYLDNGAFAGLRARGLPDARATYFLDPWNSPYWLRHKCNDDGSRRIVYLYSLGPNRRRDSTDWERGGDDLRVVMMEVESG